ncbi:MAG: NAD(P)-dependent oxidoreductase, partial [Proteobacteria bacterium]|nr:NAD(P)-dependent oxidoreductase [Pseudomonadota bacterium]
MSEKVLITANGIGAAGMNVFASRGIQVFKSNEPATEDELCESAERHQVAVIIASRAKVTARLLDASSNLKGIVKTGVGLDAIDVDAATERGIVVCNGAGVNAPAVAELAFSHILSLVRQIVPLDTAMKQGGWPRSQYRVRGLDGAMLGIVGLGNIGRRVAAMARPFGAKLCAYSPHAPDEAFEPDIKKIDSLEELLAMADVVSLHTPARPENRRLFGANLFSLMKPDALFVNTGRGS